MVDEINKIFKIRIIMIRFLTDSNGQETLIFGNVEVNQFFVNEKGSLCQKSGHDNYLVIADKEGVPFAFEEDAQSDDRIYRILPHVFKIEF